MNNYLKTNFSAAIMASRRQRKIILKVPREKKVLVLNNTPVSGVQRQGDTQTSKKAKDQKISTQELQRMYSSKKENGCKGMN